MTAQGKAPHGSIAVVLDDWSMGGVRVLLGHRSDDTGGSMWRTDGGKTTLYIQPSDQRTEPNDFARMTTDEAFALHLALAEHFGREAVSDVGFMRDTLKVEQARVDRLIGAVVATSVPPGARTAP